MYSPVDYSLCCQRVTVYRKTADSVLRTELDGCCLQWQEQEDSDVLGRRTERKFLLIQPGAAQQVFPGDRVYDGIGPEITMSQWPNFLPVQVPGLGEVAYAAPYYWQGIFCHTEAGRK